MNKNSKIIAIRAKNSLKAYDEFVELMRKTEAMFKNDASQNPSYYKNIKPSDLESDAVAMIKRACEGTLFDPENVELVSGQRFPDIIAEQYYGVEVKSTKKDSWTSIGSSIVESTRIDNVDDIYVLFGKLGGTPEFSCRPYQEVMVDIAVTHSPRYKIDMTLEKGKTIFDKMGVSYNKFRKYNDKISIVRNHYRSEAIKQKRNEMPWWITSDNIDDTQSFNIRLWKNLESNEQQDLLRKCMILFPEALNPKSYRKTKYDNTTLWLCSYKQVVMSNIRDLYSAGGKITHVDKECLPEPVSHVFYVIVQQAREIKKLLTNPSDELLAMIKEFNKNLFDSNNRYETWLDYCCKFAEKCDVPLRKWIEKNSKLQLSK